MSSSQRTPRGSSSLRAPLKDALDVELSEGDVQRIWRDVQRASSAPVRPARARAIAIGAGALVLCSALALWLLRASAPHAVGPLALMRADSIRSGLGPAQVFGGEQPARLSLDDGSQVELGRAARLEVLENSSRRFATRLRAGRGEFDVVPGGSRSWSIACGDVTVDVVGTQFAIERSQRGVRVEVSRGVVRVSAPGMTGGAQRLTAGETVYVPAAIERALIAPTPEHSAAASQAPAAVDGDGVATPAAVRALEPTAVPPAPASAPDVRTPSDRGAHGTPPAASADLWLRQADAARRAGRDEEAKALLERIVQRARGRPHAALAALTLARLVMADEPARAAAALAAVAAAHNPEGLREDIAARLVEAYARAGQRDRAREAAAGYARAFPRGRRLDEVKLWARPARAP
ncbi:MAG TPA: FecR family protein [Polyangiales bacterium]|nr:FecR family protein [Polyangiales bacterium]